MSFKERIAKALFGDVIESEARKSSQTGISHVDEDSQEAAVARALFGGFRDIIQKSSKQILDQPRSVSQTEGVLPDIDFEIFNRMYEQTSWVRAVVDVIAKAVTARGWSLAPVSPEADPKNRERLMNFFNNANPNDTISEILIDVTRDVYVFGNAFLEVVQGPDGKPKELWNLDAPTIRVKADEHGGITGYIQASRFSIKAGRVNFEPSEVIHFKLGTRGATLYGLSPLASLILPVTVDKFAQVYNRAFFLNGAKVRGAFIMKNASPEQVERNREYLQARAKNLDMAQSDLVLEGEIEVKQIGINQKDMEFLSLREFTRNEILAVYGVPPSKVSIIETGNIGAGTGEHQTQTFYEECIQPFQMRVAEKITKKIIRDGFGIMDWSFQFNRRSIDEKAQAEIFNIYLQNGVFTSEEVRQVVAPKMPEMRKAYELQKRLAPSETIVDATRAVVSLENRFAEALKRLFREIKNTVAEKLPKLRPEVIRPKLSSLGIKPPFEYSYERTGDLAFRKIRWPETIKELSELEGILELIDQGRIAEVVQRFTLEVSRKGARLSARRNKLEQLPEDVSRELDESLRLNASQVAAGVSSSIKDSLRQSLIEGIAESETIPQLMRRIETQLDSVAAVNVRPATDSLGRVIRAGHVRTIDRSTAAEIIARTEANRAFNLGNLDALRQAEIEKVQWLLASDACPICTGLAETVPGQKLGRIMPIGEATSVIPAHPNCRCTWVSVLEEL